MNEAQIIKIIEESVKKSVTKAVDETVPPVIKKVVNGKIDALHEKLNDHIQCSQDHWNATEQFMKDLTPVRDGLFSIQSINKFAKWLGLPAVGAGIIWFLFR